MMFNTEGENLLRQFEGCRLNAYQDSSGIWTIGYGHTLGVDPNETISEDEAESIFQNDIAFMSSRVKQIVNAALNSNQFSAAVCFAFNVRGYAFTPLFKFLMSGDIESAKAHWLLYDKITINGQKVEVEGLRSRRQAELNLFCKALGA